MRAKFIEDFCILWTDRVGSAARPNTSRVDAQSICGMGEGGWPLAGERARAVGGRGQSTGHRAWPAGCSALEPSILPAGCGAGVPLSVPGFAGTRGFASPFQGDGRGWGPTSPRSGAGVGCELCSQIRPPIPLALERDKKRPFLPAAHPAFGGIRKPRPPRPMSRGAKGGRSRSWFRSLLFVPPLAAALDSGRHQRRHEGGPGGPFPPDSTRTRRGPTLAAGAAASGGTGRDETFFCGGPGVGCERSAAALTFDLRCGGLWPPQCQSAALRPRSDALCQASVSETDGDGDWYV